MNQAVVGKPWLRRLLIATNAFASAALKTLGYLKNVFATGLQHPEGLIDRRYIHCRW